jgi:hypothetical protein
MELWNVTWEEYSAPPFSAAKEKPHGQSCWSLNGQGPPHCGSPLCGPDHEHAPVLTKATSSSWRLSSWLSSLLSLRACSLLEPSPLKVFVLRLEPYCKCHPRRSMSSSYDTRYCGFTHAMSIIFLFSRYFSVLYAAETPARQSASHEFQRRANRVDLHSTPTNRHSRCHQLRHRARIQKRGAHPETRRARKSGSAAREKKRERGAQEKARRKFSRRAHSRSAWYYFFACVEFAVFGFSTGFSSVPFSCFCK